jgi:hypothetical protein
MSTIVKIGGILIVLIMVLSSVAYFLAAAL